MNSFKSISNWTNVSWRVSFWMFVGCLLTLCCHVDERHQPSKSGESGLTQLPNQHGLVTVGWLKTLLDAHDTPEKPGKSEPEVYPKTSIPIEDINRFVIVEASWADVANAADYHRGHIPGAIHVNTDLFEDGYPTWRLKPVTDLQKTIGDLGITPNTMVIVYSEQFIAAARTWWVLMYAGVADVRILDGDARTWQESGFNLEQTVNEPSPVDFSAAGRDSWLMDTATLRQHLDRNSIFPAGLLETWRLYDMRSQAEYEGEISGYSYLDAKGRIPTAVWLGDADDSARTFKLANGRLRAPGEVLTEWKANGLELASEELTGQEPLVIFYCGGGWRSSAAFYYAWLHGAKNIRNYSAGWQGWSTQYIPDESATSNTPGWVQVPTDNPIEISVKK